MITNERQYQITQAQASRGLRRTRRFLEIVLEGGEIA